MKINTINFSFKESICLVVISIIIGLLFGRGIWREPTEIQEGTTVLPSPVVDYRSGLSYEVQEAPIRQQIVSDYIIYDDYGYSAGETAYRVIGVREVAGKQGWLIQSGLSSTFFESALAKEGDTYVVMVAPQGPGAKPYYLPIR